MQNTQSLLAHKKIAYQLSKVAVKALYDELALFPKPGLVSFVDNGAHKDMDAEVLFRSLFSLRHYFYQISLYAIENKPLTDQVKLGIDAERQMLHLTNGVNTHRGAIFALGILCTSVARLMLNNETLSLVRIHSEIKRYWSDFLKHKHHTIATTHGAQVKQKYGASGAKEMAVSGYKLVFDVYQHLSASSIDKTLFGLKAYCLLLSRMEDTNILHRTGLSGQCYAKRQVNTLIHNQYANLVEKMTDIHQAFCKRNISPGGVADMLGVIYFLKMIL